jgi:F-box and WD-40 domain protein CDC4
VYSVVLDSHRNLACSGSMDGTVRVWNLRNGECQHTLTGHTSLVGLLGLSPSYLVSAAADSTLRVWDPETGELRHTLAAHNGAITCFQHDEFKVLSGSDGTLKMWDIRDGSQVRDLLTGIVGVWQVIFEGRWCIAASNRVDSTVLDVWDFGHEDGDDEWEGEPPGGIYDEDSEDDDENEAEVDAMDQDLDMGPSDSEEANPEGLSATVDEEDQRSTDWQSRPSRLSSRSASSSLTAQGPSLNPFVFQTRMDGSGTGPSRGARPLPSNDETPTRPRIRHAPPPRRR